MKKKTVKQLHEELGQQHPPSHGTSEEEPVPFPSPCRSPSKGMCETDTTEPHFAEGGG